MRNKPLFAIFLIVFLDLLGFGLILPLLPYYAETFNASDTMIGLLVASNAATQLIGAPLLGRFSDRWGRRPILIISLIGTGVSFILLGIANSLLILFISRILDGLTGANISVAQAYITDVTDESNRAKGLGLVGAAFGLGFILGPATGGLLSQFGYGVPAFAASALVAINLVMVIFWLPESLSEEQRQAMASEEQPRITLGAMITALKRPLSGPLLTTRFIFGLAFSTFQTIFSLYALRRFNLGAQQTGFILAYVGLLSVIVQGGLIGILTKRFREELLIILSVAIMAVSLFAWGFAPSVTALLFILAPTALAGGVLNTVISSALTKTVTRQAVGGLLGLSSSLESLTRVIAPTIGGFLLGQLGSWSPGVFGAVLLVGLFAYVWLAIYKKSPQKSVAAA